MGAAAPTSARVIVPARLSGETLASYTGRSASADGRAASNSDPPVRRRVARWRIQPQSSECAAAAHLPGRLAGREPGPGRVGVLAAERAGPSIPRPAVFAAGLAGVLAARSRCRELQRRGGGGGGAAVKCARGARVGRTAKASQLLERLTSTQHGPPSSAQRGSRAIRPCAALCQAYPLSAAWIWCAAAFAGARGQVRAIASGTPSWGQLLL
jgi:hypothetical protein